MAEKTVQTVDILVPVYHPDRKLRQLIYMLNRQTKRPGKILLMVTVPEGTSVPEAEREIGNWTAGSKIAVECHFLSKSEFDHGGTRNRGMKYCNGDIVICMTQDSVPKDDRMVEELITPLLGKYCDVPSGREGSCDIILSYGRQLPDKGCKLAEQYTRNFNYPPESRIKTKEDIPVLGIKTFFASNVCAAYRRELFLKQGGFPERTIFNEDMIFAGRVVRAGYGIAYAAEAKVVHSHNLSGIEQFHRNFDLAVSQAENPDVFGGIRSEGEGIRLVKGTISYLLKRGRFYLVPGVIWTSGCKYMGYLLGKRYRSLPKKLVRACSMNKGYWGEK